MQWLVKSADRTVEDAYNLRYESYLLAEELRLSSDDLTKMVRSYVVTGEPAWKNYYQEIVAIRAGKQDRPAGYDDIYWDFRAVNKAIEGSATPAISIVQRLNNAGFSDQELRLLEEANALSRKLVEFENTAIALTDNLARDQQGKLYPYQAEHLQAIELVHGSHYLNTKADIMVLINQFFGELNTRTDNTIAAAKRSANQWLLLQIISSIISFGIFFVLLYAIFTQVIRALRSIMVVLDTVAKGDLTHSVSIAGRDETAQLASAVTQMQGSLKRIVASVRSSSNSIATATSQIFAGTYDLASRTEEQSSALAETAATMEEITSTIRNSADNVSEANRLARNTSDTATESGQSVLALVRSMEGLNNHSQKMAEIINVINGIAFQTNILALNAAV